MFREAVVAAVALAGHVAVEAYKLEKRDGAGGHHHSAGAAAAPASGYEHPGSSYGAPADNYGAPAPSYGAPEAAEPSYSAPAPSYGVTGYEDTDAGLPDLTPIIIGILALVGLSLLFPTFVSLTSVRKKRDTLAEEVNPMLDVVDRVNDIYSAVAQSEECMERIACELGGIVADSTSYGKYARLATGFVPSQYKKLYKKFASGKNCHKIACGTLDF